MKPDSPLSREDSPKILARPSVFLVSSLVATTLSWGTLIVAGRHLGPSGFAIFSGLWGFYFAIVGLLYGLQQEITRASASQASRVDIDTSMSNGSRRARARALVLVLALMVTTFVAALTSLRSLPLSTLPLATTFALGCGGYALYSLTNGVLAGTRQWRSLSTSVLLETGIRLVCVTGVILLGGGAQAVTLAIVSGGFAWAFLFMNRDLRHRMRSTNLVGATTTRVFLAMAISGASALTIAGYAFLVLATNAAAPSQSTGGALAAITAIRAPLMVAAGPLAVIVVSRGANSDGFERIPRRQTMTIAAVAILVIATGAIASYYLATPMLRFAFGAGFAVDPALSVSAFVSSLAFAGLAITAAHQVARDRHLLGLTGWLIALALTVASLIESPANVKLQLSLWAPPVVALATVGICRLLSVRRSGHPR